jgi:hypothetical protein
LPKHTREAVRFYWQTRTQQVEKQRQAGPRIKAYAVR